MGAVGLHIYPAMGAVHAAFQAPNFACTRFVRRRLQRLTLNHASCLLFEASNEDEPSDSKRNFHLLNHFGAIGVLGSTRVRLRRHPQTCHSHNTLQFHQSQQIASLLLSVTLQLPSLLLNTHMSSVLSAFHASKMANWKHGLPLKGVAQRRPCPCGSCYVHHIYGHGIVSQL